MNHTWIPTPEATAISIKDASFKFGGRTIWSDLNVNIKAGQIVAVLGPNGAGKTSLVRVLLGLDELSYGSCSIAGEAPRRGSPNIGYVPQQGLNETGGVIRARDFVGFGLDGHKFGISGLITGYKRRLRKARVDAALAEVDATELADVPLDLVSGGERQRLQIAQALIGQPPILLSDEPLLSLDLARQHQMVDLFETTRRNKNTTVMVVTHEINPLLEVVDQVVYLANGRARVGTVAEVMTTESLSDLYQTPVEVVEIRGRMLVIGCGLDGHHIHDGHHVHEDYR